ncbi:MAG: tetratricopeptide repeat protein [Bacteroidetes bacterium]|nr:tetratricopeptide repeat protein [Bacteroidota bacterium]
MNYNLLLTLFCLAGFSLSAQRSPKADSVGVVNNNTPTQTRALVIGISSYQDSTGINNLRYANRDAKIFADFLKSPAGGALPPENVWLMTNQEATLGAIDNALNWLIKETKKGDKVIIYFSGHGDVENQTLWQRGFLLTYGTPAHLYRNNAVRVEDLDEIIKTLSVGNEAKVVVILDACRSGKLAKAGPELTAEQLQKQAENEVRILSCKPDQKSMEGEAWGGGRGLFSFYLVNGLKGLANKGGFMDNTVTFRELQRFVEDKMEESIRENNIAERQNPVFIGDESFELAEVDEVALNEASQDMGLVMATPSSPLGDRGVSMKSPDEKASTSKNDALIQFIQNANLDSLVADPIFGSVVAANDSKRLLQFFTEKLSAVLAQQQSNELLPDFLPAFQAAVKNAENDANLRQHLQELLAARLHDQTQTVINAYLRGDAKELDKRRYIDQAEKYVKYPQMLQAALQLLPKDHLLYHEVAVKYHYFDGVCTRLASQMSDDQLSGIPAALEMQKQALTLDDKAPYIHNEMGILYLALGKEKLSIKHFETAIELAPSWALPLVNLSNLYRRNGDLKKAKTLAEKAQLLQPDYYGSYLSLGQIAEQNLDLLTAETQYRKARSLNDQYYIPFERRAYLLMKTGRFEEANEQFNEMEIRKSGQVNPILDMEQDGFLDHFDGPPDISPYYDVEILPAYSPEIDAYFLAGKKDFGNKQYGAAELNFKKVMRLEPNHIQVYHYLGQICFEQKRYEEAEVYFQRQIELRPDNYANYLQLANVYRDWGRPKEEEAIYREILTKKPDFHGINEVYMSMIALLDKQARYTEEELMLWERYNAGNFKGSGGLEDFYDKMTSLYPNNAEWLYRYANYISNENPTYYNNEGIEQYLKVTELDTLFSARAYIFEKAGDYYLKAGKDNNKNESYLGWESDLPLAIKNYRKAISLAPSQPGPKYGLAKACLSIFEYEEALTTLSSLRDSNDLDFDSRLMLADLLIRSGHFAEGQALLDKAADIQPEAIAKLPELNGLAQKLQGNIASAIQFYQQEIALHSMEDNSDRYYILAELFASQGKKTEALEWLKTAFENGFYAELVVKYDPLLNKLRGNMDFEDLLVRHEMK